ncbi:MAG: FHIPEP family type III secretion protein, partial [Alphaproteobacteria bacterium]
MAEGAPEPKGRISLPRMNLPGMRRSAQKTALRSDILFALGIIGILMVLVFPVPPWLLDLLLSISFTVSVLILMTVLFVSKPLDMSSFPTILLVATLLRLALNIATTRLILAHGHDGPAAAGHVIQAFGNFITEGSVLIGAIIFGILTIINFIVITKGSGRIAEVSARFSLDAMPGKQMAIDADLSAGMIDEKEAKRRRKELEDESGFFGAMDGASKFVRGDAIAGLLITFINLIGGMIIGIVVNDLTFSEALDTYTKLTIGDGLVSQIPALIVSTGAGMLVTKAGVDGSSDKAVLGQLSRMPAPIGVTSFLLMGFALLPGIPFAPFFVLSLVTAYIAYTMHKTNKVAAMAAGVAPGTTPPRPGESAASAGQPTAPTEEKISDTLHIDSLRLELGYGLLPLINYQKGHRLTEQIKALRKQIAREYGFVMPPVRIQDNMQLP